MLELVVIVVVVVVVVVVGGVVVAVVVVVVVVVLPAPKFDSNRRLAFALSLPRESVAKFHIYTIKLDAFLCFCVFIYLFFFFLLLVLESFLTFCPEERYYRLPI